TNIFNYMIFMIFYYLSKAFIKYELQIISKSRNERLSGLRKQAACHALCKDVLQPLRLNNPREARTAFVSLYNTFARHI
ncbi:TPA: hypothetical protein ACJJY2_005026, partial [Enterobacter asburiae]